MNLLGFFKINFLKYLEFNFKNYKFKQQEIVGVFLNCRFLKIVLKFFFILYDRILDGVILLVLKLEYVKVLKSDWVKQSNVDELEGYFRSVIEKFESSCLLDKNGRILVYICMQYNGFIVMIYVLFEFRKEGYFDIFISDLI